MSRFLVPLVTVLILMMAATVFADDGGIKIPVIPTQEDRAISCEIHCAYAEMGNDHALQVIQLLPCECGFDYNPKENQCLENL